MKYINMYYGTKGGYVSGSERFDSAAEAAEKGMKSENFALVLPYTPKAERNGVQVTPVAPVDTKVPFGLEEYEELVMEDGTHKVVTGSGMAVKVLDCEEFNHVILKLSDADGSMLDYIDALNSERTGIAQEQLFLVRAY